MFPKILTDVMTNYWFILGAAHDFVILMHNNKQMCEFCERFNKFEDRNSSHKL